MVEAEICKKNEPGTLGTKELERRLEIRMQQLERLVASGTGSRSSGSRCCSSNASETTHEDLHNELNLVTDNESPAESDTVSCNITAPPTRESSAVGIALPSESTTTLAAEPLATTTPTTSLTFAATAPAAAPPVPAPDLATAETTSKTAGPQQLPQELWEALCRAGRRLGRTEADLKPVAAVLAANWFDSRRSLSRLSEAAALELKIPLGLLAALRSELRSAPSTVTPPLPPGAPQAFHDTLRGSDMQVNRGGTVAASRPKDRANSPRRACSPFCGRAAGSRSPGSPETRRRTSQRSPSPTFRERGPLPSPRALRDNDLEGKLGNSIRRCK